MQTLSTQTLHSGSSPLALPLAIPLAKQPLTLLVGVTGVGKSTTLEHLAQMRDFVLLPNRREMTDAFIFAGETVTDRAERFRRTKAYRQQHSGGMSGLLETLSIPEQSNAPLLFDGIRGLEEVRHAARNPLWRFVLLDAPDLERAKRLLTRADEFDQMEKITSSDSSDEKNPTLEQLLNLEGIADIFSSAEIAQLSQLPQEGSEIVAKVKIVVEERKNYDPKAARNYLLSTLEPARVIYLDTVLLSPPEVAQKLQAWL
jgi:energy-coupling factor transporter ATP-binding protein EcfA2